MNYLKITINYKCYIMIEFNVLKNFLLTKQMHQKSAIFLTIGIFHINGLRFNQMSAINAMIY